MEELASMLCAITLVVVIEMSEAEEVEVEEVVEIGVGLGELAYIVEYIMIVDVDATACEELLLCRTSSE